VFYHYNITIYLSSCIGITVAWSKKQLLESAACKRYKNFIVSSSGRTGVYLPGCELLQIIQTEIDKLTAQL
jgi:hypothetical protein